MVTLLPNLCLELSKIGLAPHLPTICLVQKFAHEYDLVGIITGCLPKLVLRMQVDQRALLQLFLQFLA